MDIIKSNSISYEKIKDDIINFVLSHDEDARWRSFMESNAGSIIIELIAGLGSFRAYYDMMAERESSLETAISTSAILEHAADRGLLLSPTHSGILTVHIKASENLNVIRGDQIGFLSSYELYAMESFFLLKGEEKKFDCVVGHLNHFEQDIVGFGNFDKYEFFLKDEMAALEFESLEINGKVVDMQSDLNYLEANKGSFVLRRVLPKEIRIYSGNGILGFADSTAKKLSYKVLSYGRDLDVILSGSTPSVYIKASLIAHQLKTTPDFEINAEKIRGTARYYPLDGRIVTDQDYTSAIMKYFGDSIHDIYTYNSDPNEEIYMIVKDSLTDGDIDEIKSMVDSKRGLGMKVIYHIVRENSGKIMDCNFAVADTSYSFSVEPAIRDYLNTRIFKYIRANKSISTWELATELSNYLGIVIKPRRLTIQGTLDKVFDNNILKLDGMDFIKEFRVSVSLVPYDQF